MTNQLLLYIIETNRDRAQNLRSELKHLHEVTILETYADAEITSGGLQAIFVPLMAALDWGIVTPPVPLHQTRVIKMPSWEVAKGRPQYAIPGIATSPEESLSPIEITRLILEQSFKAIQNFNQANPIRLTSVGVAALSLGLEKLSPGEVLKLLKEAYRLLIKVAEPGDQAQSRQHSPLTA